MSTHSRHGSHSLACLLSILAAACSSVPQDDSMSVTGPAVAAGLPAGAVTQEQVLRGRQLAIDHDCGGCHGGAPNPAAKGWLAGKPGKEDAQKIGPFLAYPRNLTPDDETGLGRISERQIFNALRYGLRPSATPDIEVTSAIPGQGNHPTAPNYLSPGMPWVWWRFMADDELWAIAAYLKHGLRPVSQPAAVPAALDELVDAAVSRYQHWAHGSPVMLVHAATAPRAAALVLPALPTHMWLATYNTAWAVSAAISAIYRPSTAAPPPSAIERAVVSVEDLTDLAVSTRDEHVIKFVEVAQESHRRGNDHALTAGARAAALIQADD